MTCPLNFEIPVFIVRDEGGAAFFADNTTSAAKLRHSKLLVSNSTVQQTWLHQFMYERAHAGAFCLAPHCHCSALLHVREAHLYNARDLYEYIGVHSFFGTSVPTLTVSDLRRLPLINLQPPDLFNNNWFQKTARRDVMAGCGIFVVWLHRLRTPHASVAFRALPPHSVVNTRIIDADHVSEDGEDEEVASSSSSDAEAG